VGRIFLRDRLVVVASPSLPRPSDGEPVPAVIRGAMKQAETWTVTTPSGPSIMAAKPMLSLSSLVMVRDAVRMGVGAARLPLSLVSPDLAAGTLVHWGDVEGPEIALWALYPTRRLLSARVSAFLDYLREAFPRGTPDELAAYVGR
jgi:DNA-binding transcriptional LysR family regulator